MNIDSDKINEAFNRDLQQQIEGKLSKGYIYRLGNPNDILLSAGMPDLPIEITSASIAKKSSSEYIKNHPFNLSEIKNLPDAINNPIMVFDSKTRLDSKTILTELKSEGVNFLVAVQTNYLKKSNRVVITEVNSIRSIYPKDKVNDIINWINSKKLLRYRDKRKALIFLKELQSQGLQKSFININALNLSTKVIQNFENPKLKLQIGDHFLTPKQYNLLESGKPLLLKNVLSKKGVLQDIEVKMDAQKEIKIFAKINPPSPKKGLKY